MSESRPCGGRCSGPGTKAEACGRGLFPDSQQSWSEPAEPRGLLFTGGGGGGPLSGLGFPGRPVLPRLQALVCRVALQEGLCSAPLALGLFPSVGSVPLLLCRLALGHRQAVEGQWGSHSGGSAQLPPPSPRFLSLPRAHLSVLSPFLVRETLTHLTARTTRAFRKVHHSSFQWLVLVGIY